MPIVNGVRTITVHMDDIDKWSSVLGKNASEAPDEFKKAINRIGRVGITFGGCGHFGHGASATHPAKMSILKFTVE